MWRTPSTRTDHHLPIITGADVRLAESVLQIQPGYLPMRPNGYSMFRGSQFNSRMNGGQTMATENFFDGAAFGYAVGHQQSHESTPPVEAVQEMKVISTTYSAQYGHTSGGFIDTPASPARTGSMAAATSISPTTSSTRTASFPRESASTRRPCATTIPGSRSVVPLCFPATTDRSKTFFFTNFDYTRLRSAVLPGFGNTTPLTRSRTATSARC